VDAGIPQAEARDEDKCALVTCILTFHRACAGAFACTTAGQGKTGSATRASEHRVRAKGCPQLRQNRAGPGAAFSSRRPRLPSMPVLLQLRLQFARHTVQLLSKGRGLRALLPSNSASRLSPGPELRLFRLRQKAMSRSVGSRVPANDMISCVDAPRNGGSRAWEVETGEVSTDHKK